MLFHVYVALRGKDNDSAFQFGLTEENLKRRVIRRYEQGRAFIVDGKIIEPSEIDRIRIARSPEPVESLLARARAEDRASPLQIIPGTGVVKNIAFGYCEEVTDEYITGPPGEKRTVRRQRAPRPQPKERKVQEADAVQPSKGLSIDESRFRVTFEGQVHTFRERSKLLFTLLARLETAKGQAVRFAKLQEKDDVWNGVFIEDSTIRSAITRLRKKLRDAKMARLADSIKVTTYDGRPCVILDLHDTPSDSR